MRIAIAADDDMINRYFLDSKWFLLYDVEGQEVTRELKVPSLGEGQEALIRALADYRDPAPEKVEAARNEWNAIVDEW